MDTSETYIKMCEKAEEIQGFRQWEYYDNELFKVTRTGNYTEGDVVCADGVIVILGHTPYLPKEYSKYGLDISMVGYDEGDSLGGISKLIWLPRQDQLQEMCNKEIGLQSLTWLIHDFSESEYGSVFTISGSMEQLWLAFVMKEKFSKIWDKEKWVNADF